MLKRTIDILTRHKILLIIYIIAAIWAVLMQYFSTSGPSSHNNYDIYTGVARHFFDLLPLYGPSPAEYSDMNHYGPIFAFIIYPFSLLPHLLGVTIWVVFTSVIFCLAVRQLPISVRAQAMILLLCVSEFYNAAAYQQFNTLTVAMIILSYTLIAKQREGLSALMIVVGTMVKLYGIVGLAFFFFIKPERRVRFVAYLALWVVVLLGLQIIFTSWDYVIGQYSAWIVDLGSKNGTNQFSPFQNRGLLGMIRKISGDGSYSDLWIIGGGLLLYFASCLRKNRWADRQFQLLLLSSTLLFVVLFSSGTETCSYITAMAGVGIWWFAKPERATQCDPNRVLDWSLLIFVLIGSLANALFPPSIYYGFIFPYALKALPFTIVWFRCCYELLMKRK